MLLSDRKLLDDGKVAAAADQPPHSGEVEYSDPEAIEKTVIRPARMTRPIDDVHMGDLEPFPLDEGRHEAVQGVEIRKRQIDIAPKRLEAAAGIAGSVAQDPAADPVGDARLPFLVGTVLASGALARHQRDFRIV